MILLIISSSTLLYCHIISTINNNNNMFYNSFYTSLNKMLLFVAISCSDKCTLLQYYSNNICYKE